MTPMFLTTFLTCGQVISVASKIQMVVGLTQQQKTEIMSEIKKVAPSCPIIITPDERKTKTSN